MLAFSGVSGFVDLEWERKGTKGQREKERILRFWFFGSRRVSGFVMAVSDVYN